ncbi:MAG: methyl-accepting chemotaxis protein [Lachnospiraceae bacterium]|nr:methyl-accepting chemotaxis protein [Lachnospiraceae bacterium]
MNQSRSQKSKKTGFFGSVRFRLMAIIIAIMAVPLITIIIISYVSSHKEAVMNMEDMNVAQANLVEHDFSAIVEQNRNVIQTIASSVTVRKVLKGEADTADVIEWLAQSDATVGDGNTTVITGPDGMQVARPKGDLVDVADREYFKICKSEKRFYVSDQNISKTSGKRICTFITPVIDADGTFLGAVQRNYDLPKFTDLCKSEMTGTKQDIFIGDNNGDLIAHTSMDLETGEPVNFSAQAWYGDSRNDMEAAGSYDSSFNGGNWKISYQRDPVTGWVTVIATNKEEALASANRMLTIIVGVGIIMLIGATVLSILLANSFTKPIIAVNESIDKLSDGEFRKIEDKALAARSDEFGDIVRNINKLVEKLSEVVENIKAAAATVNEQARELSDTSSQISTTTDDVSNAVQEIARGATEQAGTVEKASENMNSLSEAIQTVASNAEQLATAASDMNGASQSSADALKQLSNNMDTMGHSVSDISEVMRATNAAVQNVNDKVDGITSIASQTNLLALNASIEAARAGDAGKGFAVVAEEIGKLATESATTAQEIRDEMSNLLRQAQEAAEKTSEVSDIGTSVNEVLVNTVDKINMLINGVGSTVDGVNTISGLTQECDASKAIIVEAMTSLAAISEENAASTEETSASMQELNATINVLTESARSLNDVAEKLGEDLQFFKI